MSLFVFSSEAALSFSHSSHKDCLNRAQFRVSLFETAQKRVKRAPFLRALAWSIKVISNQLKQQNHNHRHFLHPSMYCFINFSDSIVSENRSKVVTGSVNPETQSATERSSNRSRRG